MQRRILLVLLTAMLLTGYCFMAAPKVLAEEPYRGLDYDDDVPDMSNIDVGNDIANAIINFLLGTITSVMEVLFDALIKAPYWALMASWTVVYNAFLGWGLAAPFAWALSTLLFMMLFIFVGFGILQLISAILPGEQ